MNALGPEPESGGRLGRMGIGLGIAIALGLALVFGADHIVPSKRLLAEVLPIEMVEDREVPPKKEEPPPPPPPELPKPKPKKVEPQEAAPAVPPPPDAPPPPADQPQADPVGLDSTSFGAGTGGPAFHVGTSQMGTPGGFGRGAAEKPQTETRGVTGPKLVEARSRPGNALPPYTDKARRRNIQGLMVIEADIDDQGRVTRAVVRAPVDAELDAATLKAVKTWSFDPATLAGRPVASTKFLRFRFELK
jgi:protein TonB